MTHLFGSACLRSAKNMPDGALPHLSIDACLRASSLSDLPSAFVLDSCGGSERSFSDHMKRLTGAAKLFRLSVFLTAGDHLLFLTPSGPDEPSSEDEFMFCIEQSAALTAALGIPCRIGLLSGGRLGDIGRCARTDETIRRGRSLEKKLNDRGFSAVHHTILIEDAVPASNLLAAPDSLSGELIVRAAAGVGGGREIGSVFIFMPDGETPDLSAFPAGRFPLICTALTEKADPDNVTFFSRLLAAVLSADAGSVPEDRS